MGVLPCAIEELEGITCTSWVPVPGELASTSTPPECVDFAGPKHGSTLPAVLASLEVHTPDGVVCAPCGWLEAEVCVVFATLVLVMFAPCGPEFVVPLFG